MIDMSIPGQMSENELRGVEAIARSVPKGACVVEAGSLFGRSSYTWATSVSKDSKVYCIDPWVREPWVIELVETKIPGCPIFRREEFDKYTSMCKNIVPLQGYSPGNFKTWNKPIDVFFDDAVHYNPGIRQNLRFWLQFLKPLGFMCGHDYCSEFPDVVAEVDKLAADLGTKVSTRENLWWIEMPKAFDRKDWKLSWWKVLTGRY